MYLLVGDVKDLSVRLTEFLITSPKSDMRLDYHDFFLMQLRRSCTSLQWIDAPMNTGITCES